MSYLNSLRLKFLLAKTNRRNGWDIGFEKMHNAALAHINDINKFGCYTSYQTILRAGVKPVVAAGTFGGKS